MRVRMMFNGRGPMFSQEGRGLVVNSGSLDKEDLKELMVGFLRIDISRAFQPRIVEGK